MYLEEIEVHNWRGIVQQKLTLAPGINIIHGPNESGKSSLRGAVRAALLQNPGSKARDALAVRPWASSLNPRVRVAFQLDGEPWVVEKTFFSTTGSRLYRKGKLIASDRAVHEKLEEVLSNAVWMGHLWSEQGDVSLHEVPRALRGKLVAEEVVSPGVLWLEEQLKAEQGNFWTEKTGAPKKPVKDARAAAIEAEEAVDEAEARLQASNELSAEVASLRHEVEEAANEEKALAEKLTAMQERVGAWDRYRAAVAQWKAKAEAGRREADVLERWQRASARLAEQWRARAEHQAQLKALLAQMGAEPSRQEIDRLDRLVKYLSRLEQKLIAEEMRVLNAPTASQLARLRQLERELEKLEATLQASAMTLTLTALSDLRPDVITDGIPCASGPLEAGSSTSWTANRDARFVLPGVAELQIQGGAPDAGSALQRRESLLSERTSLLAELGCGNLEEAESRADRARTLEAGFEGKPVAEAELAGLASGVEGADDYGGWSPGELKEKVRSLRSDLGKKEAEWGRARAQYQQHQTRYQQLLRNDPEGLLGQSYAQLVLEGEQWPNGLEKPLLPALEQIDDRWIGKLEAGEWASGLQARVDGLREELVKDRSNIIAPQGEEVTTEGVEDGKRQLAEKSARRSRWDGQLGQALGRLSERDDDYERLVKAREQSIAMAGEARKVELQAAATQLLMTTFQVGKAALQSDLVGPLQDRVARRLSSLTGGRYRGLRLDDKLTPAAVTPREVESAELGDLSFGTREQLIFVTRLCLAEMLSEKHSRQSLLFDDNLVHTDQERLTLAHRMLEEASASSQVVILTCHPERFDGLAGARKISVHP